MIHSHHGTETEKKKNEESCQSAEGKAPARGRQRWKTTEKRIKKIEKLPNDKSTPSKNTLGAVQRASISDRLQSVHRKIQKMHYQCETIKQLNHDLMYQISSLKKQLKTATLKRKDEEEEEEKEWVMILAPA